MGAGRVGLTQLQRYIILFQKQKTGIVFLLLFLLYKLCTLLPVNGLMVWVLKTKLLHTFFGSDNIFKNSWVSSILLDKTNRADTYIVKSATIRFVINYIEANI